MVTCLSVIAALNASSNKEFQRLYFKVSSGTARPRNCWRWGLQRVHMAEPASLTSLFGRCSLSIVRIRGLSTRDTLQEVLRVMTEIFQYSIEAVPEWVDSSTYLLSQNI